MALRKLRYDGDLILRQNSKKVENFDDRLAQLIDDMIVTMNKYGGVGLAAPQVGILKQVVVMDIGDGPMEMVNPEIVEQSEFQEDQEGCLSCPGIIGTVKRPYKVTVVAYDRNNNKIKITEEGLLARVICHEVDHLHGKLFKDFATKIMHYEHKHEAKEEK